MTGLDEEAACCSIAPSTASAERGPEKSIPRSRRDGRPAACGIDAAATLQPSSMRLPAVWILDDDDNLLVSHQGKHRIVTAGSLWMSARQSRQKQGRPSAHPSSVRRWQRRLAGDFADPGCVAIDPWSTRFNPREAAACRQRGEHLWHASRIHTRSCSCSVLTFRHPIGRMVLSTGREVVLFRTGAQDSKKKKKFKSMLARLKPGKRRSRAKTAGKGLAWGLADAGMLIEGHLRHCIVHTQHPAVTEMSSMPRRLSTPVS